MFQINLLFIDIYLDLINILMNKEIYYNLLLGILLVVIIHEDQRVYNYLLLLMLYLLQNQKILVLVDYVLNYKIYLLQYILYNAEYLKINLLFKT